jgi:hypothetical protein
MASNSPGGEIGFIRRTRRVRSPGLLRRTFRGVAQPGQSARFGTVRMVVRIHSPRRHGIGRHGDRGAARSLGMREGSVRPRVTAPRWLGRRHGLGSSKPDGRVRFPDELRLRGRVGSGAAVLTRRLRVRVPPKARRIIASVRGRDPSFRNSVSWFESSRRHSAELSAVDSEFLHLAL